MTEGAYQTPTAWAAGDPQAAQASDRIRDQTQQRYGIDVTNGEAQMKLPYRKPLPKRSRPEEKPQPSRQRPPPPAQARQPCKCSGLAPAAREDLDADRDGQERQRDAIATKPTSGPVP